MLNFIPLRINLVLPLVFRLELFNPIYIIEISRYLRGIVLIVIFCIFRSVY